MALDHDDFVVHKENWVSKGINLRNVAIELNISELQAFAFIDDNPVEIAQVQSMCEGVSTFLLPDGELQTSRYITHCWAFDTFQVTREDTSKTAMMKTERFNSNS